MSNPDTEGGHTYSEVVLSECMNFRFPGRIARLEYAPSQTRGNTLPNGCAPERIHAVAVHAEASVSKTQQSPVRCSNAFPWLNDGAMDTSRVTKPQSRLELSLAPGSQARPPSPLNRFKSSTRLLHCNIFDRYFPYENQHIKLAGNFLDREKFPVDKAAN